MEHCTMPLVLVPSFSFPRPTDPSLIIRITFARAKTLAVQYKIADALYPLFVDDPSVFLYSTNGGSSRVTAISGAFRPFGTFNATAAPTTSSNSLPAPPGNWERQSDYLNRVSTSQGEWRIKFSLFFWGGDERELSEDYMNRISQSAQSLFFVSLPLLTSSSSFSFVSPVFDQVTYSLTFFFFFLSKRTLLVPYCLLGFRPPAYSHHELPSSDGNVYLENNSPLEYRTDDSALGGMINQQQQQNQQNYGHLYNPYQQPPNSPFVDQSRYAHQRETSQDLLLEQQRRRDFANNTFRPPHTRHVDDIPFTSPIHMPSGKPSHFETSSGGVGGYEENNNVLETATSSRSSSPGSRHRQQAPYQQQAVRLISPSAVTMSPPTPRADMPSHYFEDPSTSPYLHRRESGVVFDTPQRVSSPRHHPYAPKPASGKVLFQQHQHPNIRQDQKKSSEELIDHQTPTSLNNHTAAMVNHPTW